jgi:hypothetical protein
MTLEEYLEELTDNNWHTLRQLIELERETLEEEQYKKTASAYFRAIKYLNTN